MSMLLRMRTWKGALAIFGVLCVAAGVTAAATPGARTVFKVDHQLCYTAVGKFHPPAAGNVRLINQFSPNGFVPKINPTLALHCNPVMKIINTPAGQKVYKPTNPRAHLACLLFTLPAGTTVPTPKVVVTNQFGKAVLYLGQPNLLCLPSWKGVTGPPNLKPTTPPGLNHFTCYPVKDFTGGAYKPLGQVLLQDQFSTKPVPVQINPIPQEFCLPTKKIIKTATGAKTYPIIDPATHLLCFSGPKTPIKPKVWDENQFGTSTVFIRAAKWLCLPSTKQVIH